MPTRRSLAATVVLTALGIGLALVPARGQQIHRHGFAGRQTALQRGDGNVRADEKKHDISDQSFKSQPTSEHIQLICDAGTGDSAFVHYYYETPPAPVTPVLSAGVWLKATKSGAQLRARVVFPKEPDPARPEAPLTILIVGTTYTKPRQWEKLVLENVPELLGKHLPAVRAKIGRDINTADAYIDRLVLNVYSGAGPVDLWIDDLDIGPVRPIARPDQAGPGPVGTPASQPKGTITGRGRDVQQRGGQLLVDGKPHFFRAIRHTGTPLHVLRSAGFDAVWLPHDATAELIEEAGRDGWFVIPSAPKLGFADVNGGPGDALFDVFRRKFNNTDVLFWDLGGGLTDSQEQFVNWSAAEIKKIDRRRPIGGDLWDGFQSYSSYLDVVGAHRWPLFTSLELVKYRDWLAQRRALTGPRPVFWTWVQNHLPEWYIANIVNRPVERGAGPPADGENFAEPVGPHPEQVRLLTYISIACGCRGLGFWSDRFLADSHHGRDRLQGMAILNAELEMLSPLLLSAGMSGSRTQWLETSHPYVKAALIAGQRGFVLLPMWLGPGDQYVPAQGAVTGLKVVVRGVADGYDPWLVTPAGVTCLRHRAVRTSTGTELTIDEFDMVAPIVFTDDLRPDGLIVWWQDHTRRYGRHAARWALDLAAAEYEKVRAVHVKLAEMGVQVRNGEQLLEETHRYYIGAQQDFVKELYDKAYLDATRALRPLRVLMRAHWQQAVATLDVPTASPYAVSFFSLPQHWELARDVQASLPSPSVLPNGGFELNGPIPKDGVVVSGLPGWSARSGSIGNDRVLVAAGIVPSEKLEDPPSEQAVKEEPETVFSPGRPIARADEGYLPPAPELGQGVLKLEVRSRVETDRDGKPIPFVRPLERTFLAVDSPPVRLPPGTLVRVSGWMKVPTAIGGTADGALFYDDAGGEPLAVRVAQTGGWRKFHLYRRVPQTGQISVTLALTGVGVAYFDDVKIEPLVVTTAASERIETASRPAPARAPSATPVSRQGSRVSQPVLPASYRPR